MCTAQTAKRKRRQAANGYRHMAPLRRPKYKKVSAEKADNNLMRLIAREKERANRKKKK